MLALSSMMLSLVLAVPVGWEHAGYDAEDSYYNPHETVLNAESVGAGLHTRWSVPLRKLDTCGAYAPPVVAAGRVVVPDPRGISAYNASTGRAAWLFNWPDPYDVSTPTLAIADDVLIAAGSDCNSQSDPDGYIVGLDLATGVVLWQVDSDTPVYSVAVDKGMVAISGESPSDGLVTTAYVAATGKAAWGLPDYDSSGVSANGRLLLTKGKATSAVSITTGAILWTRAAAWTAEAATPASDRFLVTNGTAMSAVDAATGRVLWTAAGKAARVLATDGRRVFRTAPHQIEALNAATGRRLWARRLTAETPTQPVRAGGLLYTGGPILNPATGATVRPTTPLTTPVITGGVAYVIRAGTLSAYVP
jgi:outer membrane protein assembly factor BamB